MRPQIPDIIIDNLHYGYSYRKLILDRLELEVPKGAIYGFLGANGAGKSTTIRSILGLLTPQKGSIRLFGKDIESNRLEVLGRVGSLIESPTIYKHLSGYDNLMISARYLHVAPQRIEAVLKLVDLQAHSRKTAGKYSTGMKQRLGMAMALLGDPELLILDEPTNGLDPSGIREFRQVIQRLHDQGKTIFLSSHLLGEIEKMATHVGILESGSLIFQGTVRELEQRKNGRFGVRLMTSDDQIARGLLQDRAVPIRAVENGLELELTAQQELPGLIEMLVSQGVRINEVSPLKDDLEKLFIDLTHR